jgi:class 3 adenylate cyclase
VHIAYQVTGTKLGEKLGRLAIHIGAPVAARAQAGEILVSGTVKDLVAGSGLNFESRGRHPLKGHTGRMATGRTIDAVEGIDSEE